MSAHKYGSPPTAALGCRRLGDRDVLLPPFKGKELCHLHPPPDRAIGFSPPSLRPISTCCSRTLRLSCSSCARTWKGLIDGSMTCISSTPASRPLSRCKAERNVSKSG